MRTIDYLFEHYGESHQNPTNKAIHWICIPLIMFSLFGLLYAIPFPGGRTMLLNWATILLSFALIFYLKHSVAIFAGFAIFGAFLLWAIHSVAQTSLSLPYVSLAVFVLAWIGQFVGHKIEGKKPSFFEDLQYLLVGPAWLMHFLYKKAGIKY